MTATNLSEITSALRDQIQNFESVISITDGMTIGKSEVVNEDVSNCPWCCVYRSSQTISPYTLGGSYDNDPILRIIIQAASFKSGEDCEDILESYVKEIVEAITSDTTIQETVDIVSSIEIAYGFINSDEHDAYFQSAIIEVNIKGEIQ